VKRSWKFLIKQVKNLNKWEEIIMLNKEWIRKFDLNIEWLINWILIKRRLSYDEKNIEYYLNITKNKFEEIK